MPCVYGRHCLLQKHTDQLDEGALCGRGGCLHLLLLHLHLVMRRIDDTPAAKHVVLAFKAVDRGHFGFDLPIAPEASAPLHLLHLETPPCT